MRTITVPLLCALVLAGCKAAPKQPAKTSAPAETSAPAATTPAPTPATTTSAAVVRPAPTITQPTAPVPRPPTEVEKRQAQDYATDAAELLNDGKAAEATAELNKAYALDRDNADVATLRRSITTDPAKELGDKWFRYSVRPGDTLGKLAKVYAGDPYKFYLLARYNDISVPKSLAAGQTIKLPGTKAIVQPVEPRPETPPPSTAEALYQEGKQLLAAGQKDAAYDKFMDAAKLRYQPARSESDALRPELVQLHSRLAREAPQKQDLDLCIAEWGRVLVLKYGSQGSAEALHPAERKALARSPY